MDKARAKEVLRLYRPGIAGDDDPEMAEALELAGRDAELGNWLKEYCALQEVIRAKFRQTPVPEGLKEQIVSERKAMQRSQSRRQVLALALVVVLGVILLPRAFHNPGNPPEDYSFAAFREWTAGLGTRYPKMELETNEIAPIHQMVRQVAGTYALPKPLEATRPTGCATNLRKWNGHAVAMICFHSGKTSDPAEPDLFLFMTDRAAIAGATPDRTPQFGRLARMSTASWSDGEKTYVLAAAADEAELRKYF